MTGQGAGLPFSAAAPERESACPRARRGPSGTRASAAANRGSGLGTCSSRGQCGAQLPFGPAAPPGRAWAAASAREGRVRLPSAPPRPSPGSKAVTRSEVALPPFSAPFTGLTCRPHVSRHLDPLLLMWSRLPSSTLGPFSDSYFWNFSRERSMDPGRSPLPSLDLHPRLPVAFPLGQGDGGARPGMKESGKIPSPAVLEKGIT